MNTDKCVRCAIKISDEYNRCVLCARVEKDLPVYLQSKNVRMFVINLIALMTIKNAETEKQGSLFGAD